MPSTRPSLIEAQSLDNKGEREEEGASAVASAASLYHHHRMITSSLSPELPVLGLD
jgi:hypothetical protein